jgi:PilZ domain-containing protein
MQRLEQVKKGKATQDGSPIVVKKAPTSPRGVLGEGALEGKIVPRKVSRTSNQRRETRHHGIADTATVRWEEDQTEAKVINVSECGLMIEAPIAPAIGDKIEITFEGCEPLRASVVWRKGYRLGLDFGEPLINLFAAC